MKNFILYILFISIFLGCKKEVDVELKFLDEYVLKDSTYFKGSLIGGLSGIDYANGNYYFVVDDSKKPRFLSAKIDIRKDTIHTINFKKVVYLNDSSEIFYKENALDLESIFVDEIAQEIHFVSEGAIKKNKKPSVFKTDLEGNFIQEFELPKSFENNSNIKHNAAFEGSSKSFDTKGFWVAMEGPLKSDGNAPTFKKTNSPIRITYFSNQTKQATKQYAYQLEHITKPPKGSININGVTAMLEYKKNHFFVIERTYQSGYGNYGNSIRIFEASISEKTSNILEIASLKETHFIPLKKRLLFDFSTIKDQLTQGIIDNIEGIAYGPKLFNGNQSLLLVSDDNFQVYGVQLNQFILMEIAPK